MACQEINSLVQLSWACYNHRKINLMVKKLVQKWRLGYFEMERIGWHSWHFSEWIIFIETTQI